MGKPEIRFKGYTDEWEQRKLGDIYGSIGNAFVGPMVLRQARYTYPIMYALPLLFGLFLTQSTQKSER